MFSKYYEKIIDYLSRIYSAILTRGKDLSTVIGPVCPIIRDTCLQHKCALYIQVHGRHPQTGEAISRFDCSFAWGPLLQIEISKEVRQGAAATESFRNEVVAASDKMAQLRLMNPSYHTLLPTITNRHQRHHGE